MTLAEKERETYEAAWAIPAYAKDSPGAIYLPLFLDMAKPDLQQWRDMTGSAYQLTVLDAGCGAGDGALALQQAKFQQIVLCDITDSGLCPEAKEFPFYQVCLWDHLATQLGWMYGGKFDYVYCCDVMEHIPTPFTMLVVSRLLEVTRTAAFFTISLNTDQFGAWVGKPLHQTLQSYAQWKEQLDTVGHVIESGDMMHCGVYLVEP